jgi:glycosyltransferase involved in cell wall biosynthesis
MKVLALTKYADLAASTRQRVLQYRPCLNAAGIDVDYRPLLGNAYVEGLTVGQRVSRTVLAQAYLSRFRDLTVSRRYDVIWLYAELFPYLPAVFEDLVFASGTPVIYDMDDAFFLQYDDRNGLSGRLLSGKLNNVIAKAARVCCGNRFLLEHANRLGARTMLLPTVVDVNSYQPAHDMKLDRRVVIGWIGSPSTWRYMRPLLPILQRLAVDLDVRIRIIGAGKDAEADCIQFPAIELVDWSEAREVAEVQAMDIGIMPLPGEPWAFGKSGYKLVQYMACALPVVASPIGANCDIVHHGVNGFLADRVDDWREALTKLIQSSELRRACGMYGRLRVERDFSLQRHSPRLIEAFRAVAAEQR